MHEIIISAIITSITSIITATITSLLTLKLSNKKNDDKLNSLSDKRLFKSRQLSDFYIPFYRLYVQNVFPESDVTKMLPETATTFLKLFEKHVDLMEYGSQELVKPFQIAYYGWKKYDYDRTLSFDFGKSFLLLTDQLFEEYSQLCTELELPLPAKANYLYKESNDDQQLNEYDKFKKSEFFAYFRIKKYATYCCKKQYAIHKDYFYSPHPLFNHLLHFLLSCDTMAISYKGRRQTYEYYKGF